MEIIVILLIFVCWAYSQKIYELNVDNNGHKNIRTRNFSEKLHIKILNLESALYDMQCVGWCKSNTYGKERKLILNCKVKRHYMYGINFHNSSQFVSAEVNLNASIYGEWFCDFKLTKPNNKTTFINLNLTFDKMEQCIDSYSNNGYEQSDLLWKIIGIVAISIGIAEAIYIAIVCVRNKESNRNDRSKLVYYPSEIWTSPPPPPLSPKMKRHDLSPRSSMNGTENRTEPARSTEQLEDNTTNMAIYEEMKPLQLIKRRVDNIYDTLRKKRLTKYQEVLSRIYENDIVMLQNGRTRPPFDKAYEPTMGFDDILLPYQ